MAKPRTMPTLIAAVGLSVWLGFSLTLLVSLSASEPEAAAEVRHFQPDGELHSVGYDYEARLQYRCNARRQPPTLISYFFTPSLAGVGIYEIDRDKLRWRVADDEQKLSFNKAPTGRWNEYEMIRITPEQAQPRIAALQDERLGIKAAGR